MPDAKTRSDVERAGALAAADAALADPHPDVSLLKAAVRAYKSHAAAETARADAAEQEASRWLAEVRLRVRRLSSYVEQGTD